jgi:hypothetical protein
MVEHRVLLIALSLLRLSPPIACSGRLSRRREALAAKPHHREIGGLLCGQPLVERLA